ncbi:MAG: M3 family oligoendopeptidase [Sedimentibacter sp.]|uniref:M3 family oligoendopeptidase n=1 Tax=Sedimentibacter sp. TaxID=1960295 RepID=UPI002980F3E9|nr:M3 family oligoendopeptidase [Sedimentibacter sp.]MDW5299206.1 M3 family oligoendopeptidase [Sedimentibacter sp.]
MKFSEYEYVRPDVETVKVQYSELIEKFNNSKNADEQFKLINEINNLSKNIDTMVNLVAVRHSINTADEFYDKENEYMDNASPHFQGFTVEYYKSLINSKFKEELKEKIAPQYFTMAEMEIKSFSDEVLNDLQEENKLQSEYDKLISSAKINYDGKILNLSQMQPYMQSLNRPTRKEAYEKYSGFFEENIDKFDEIFDKMVKIRNKIAVKLGYKDFVELAYIRMHRSEYNAKDVEKYRNQVLKYIVPLSVELRKRQAKRLGINNFKYYDKDLSFTSGNAKPKGNKDWMVDKAKQMYSELSPETKEFFNYMIENDLFDLETKPNKQSGGYCTYIQNYKSPFIFANFNGTSGDVDTLTHEAGHAFQVYESSDIDIPELIFPTLEACEIHSMSMEFITWPWMNLFFEENELKYKFSHLSDAVLFIPYGVTVDEFQHRVYENPNLNPEERRAVWREIEKKYLPCIDYENNKFYEKGGYWFKQGHIFGNPFYYIDYTLAQVCAFQYWVKFNSGDRKKAWNEYLHLCKVGGSKPFLELLKEGNLQSPFEDSTIESVIEPIRNWLDSVDDAKL